MKIRSLCLCLLVLPFSLGAQDNVSSLGDILEEAFQQMEQYELIHTLADLPPDEHARLVGDRNLAELGEDYLQGDAELEDPLPAAQHVFTALSDDLIAFVYIMAGRSGFSINLVLKSRHAVQGCIYSWSDWGIGGLRVEALKDSMALRNSDEKNRRLWTVERRYGVATDC